MKVIIAGSREFNDFSKLCSTCDKILLRQECVEIVSGTARGTDKLGEKYAITKNYMLAQFPANWSKYGNSAGYIRNEQMANYADALIAFWDGKSKGTKHMIDIAKKKKLKTRIITF